MNPAPPVTVFALPRWFSSDEKNSTESYSAELFEGASYLEVYTVHKIRIMAPEPATGAIRTFR